jgi:hypothetical protein
MFIAGQHAIIHECNKETDHQNIKRNSTSKISARKSMQ